MAMAVRLTPMDGVPHELGCDHALCSGAVFYLCSCSAAWRREHWTPEARKQLERARIKAKWKPATPKQETTNDD
jgi:hypothetical protein